MLNIEITSKKGALFVRLAGSLTNKTIKIFEKEVIDFIKKVGIKNIVINLYDLKKIDQNGLNELEKCHIICQKNKGRSLICLKENQKIITPKNLPEFTTVYDELSAVNLINS